MNGLITSIFDGIRAERERQDYKFGAQDHDDMTWSAILTEEVGEVAQAALEARFNGAEPGAVREELIQCAAVCVAWIECLDRRAAACG